MHYNRHICIQFRFCCLEFFIYCIIQVFFICIWIFAEIRNNIPTFVFSVCVYVRACTHACAHTHTNTEVCRSHGCQVAMVNKFCMVTPNCCESSVWHLLYGTLLVPRIMRWVQDFCKICEILYIHSKTPIYVPTFCVFHNFPQLFYGSSQMAIIKMFPGLFGIFRQSPQKRKIGVLHYIASTFNMTW
jgi:hypothetical protein